MSLKRTSRAQLVGPACVLLLGLGGAVGCSAYPTFKDAPINCLADKQYEFDPNTVSADVVCDGDSTPDAFPTGHYQQLVEPIEGSGRCDSTTSLVIRSSHHNDWGINCNFNSFADHNVNSDGSWQYIPRDESAWEGLSFWARAPGNTSKGFTLALDDANTTVKDAKSTPGGHCKYYNAVDGGIGGSTINAALDPATGQVVSGSAIASRLPDECGNNKGNSYTDVVTVTSEWAFYTIPWGQFTQAAYPNRVPNPVLTETGNVPGTGLLTDQLYYLSLRPSKEVDFELWMDKVRFYSKKKAGAAATAGPVDGSSGSTQTDGVECPVLTSALITDFTDTSADGGATDSTTLAVSESVYPTSGQYMVTSDVTQNNWHISGNLGDYSGFRINLDNCSRIDASAYLGIQFTIYGSVPAPPANGGSIVTFGVGTLNNAISSDWLSAHGGSSGGPGRCLPKSGTSQYDQPNCADAKKDIPVTAMPTVQRVLWTDFTGGKPDPGVTPTDIISIYWYFPNPEGLGTTSPVVPYPVDIVIDDLQFITP
jgi:hypothetical protein